MLSSDTHTEHLFSYGTLRLEKVQQAIFGRSLVGSEDALRGFTLAALAIHDKEVIALSGKKTHTMATFTGRSSDEVIGTVFALSPSELRHADQYEVPAVRRVQVVLRSGRSAWAYVDARYEARTE